MKIANSKHYRGLLLLLLFNISLLAFRMIVTHGIGYGFLAWNLVLSAVPLALSTVLSTRYPITSATATASAVKTRPISKNAIIAISTTWLLFLPNAPYIFTDFLHFRTFTQNMPAWFDLLLLATYSVTGMWFGLLSMEQMRQYWKRAFGKAIANVLIPICALLSGFGIYIGRYQRYNSWDVVSHPVRLLSDAISLLTELRVIGFTLGYGTLLLLLFYVFRPQSETN